MVNIGLVTKRLYFCKAPFSQTGTGDNNNTTLFIYCACKQFSDFVVIVSFYIALFFQAFNSGFSIHSFCEVLLHKNFDSCEINECCGAKD